MTENPVPGLSESDLVRIEQIKHRLRVLSVTMSDHTGQAVQDATSELANLDTRWLLEKLVGPVCISPDESVVKCDCEPIDTGVGIYMAPMQWCPIHGDVVYPSSMHAGDNPVPTEWVVDGAERYLLTVGSERDTRGPIENMVADLVRVIRRGRFVTPANTEYGVSVEGENHIVESLKQAQFLAEGSGEVHVVMRRKFTKDGQTIYTEWVRMEDYRENKSSGKWD